MLSGHGFFLYQETAEVDFASFTNRAAVKEAIVSGNIEDAIEMLNALNPEVQCFLSYASFFLL